MGTVLPQRPVGPVREETGTDAKQLLELEKLKLEITDLRRSAWLKPAIMIPIIATLITLGLSWRLGVFDVERKRVEVSADLLEVRRARLTEDVAKLQRDQQSLEQAKANLRSEISDLRQELDYTSDVAELRTHLEVLQSIPPDDLGTSRSFGRVLALAGDSRGRSAKVSVLLAAYRDKRTSLELKCLLSYALFKATSKVEWKDRVLQGALQNVLVQLNSPILARGLTHKSIFLRLLAGTIFTSREKVDSLKAMYDAIRNKQYAIFDLPRTDSGTSDAWGEGDLAYGDPLLIIALWDEDSTVAFRDPWFDYLGRVYALQEFKDPRTREIRSFSRLLNFAPEGWALSLAQNISRPPPGLAVRALPPDRDSPDDCYIFPRAFPLCDHLYPRRFDSKGKVLTWGFQASSSVSAYKQWLDDNNDLAAAWFDPSFRVLRSCPDSTMRRIFRKEWVSAVDLTR